MKVIEIQNNQRFHLGSIEYADGEEFRKTVYDLLEGGSRMISLTPADDKCPEKIIAVLADSSESVLRIAGGDFSRRDLKFESWAEEFPQTNYFECELSEKYGYVPVNHPWLRPVRKQNVILGNRPYELYKLKGEEVHEVAVGPIHAGVIEPGHFRFQCHGELVYNLEVVLGYQHRGIEKLIIGAKENRRIVLSESIAGDTTIGHAHAHCMAVESLMQSAVNLRADVIRIIAAEIERVALHLAGLGGIANDVGFALPAASYGRLRTLAINSLASICGSRFGKGLLIYGGVRFDLNEGVIGAVQNNLRTIQNDVRVINEYLFSSVGALSRFEETGTVPEKLASQIGLVGLSARACGLEEDVRIQYPYSGYKYNPVSMITLSTGDVFARARLRAMEIEESLRLILEQIENLPEGDVKSQTGEMRGDSGVVSITEGARGEIVHAVFTDENGKMRNYKIKDPSFNNWYGLSLAMRETAISDFPLCNKSFDLSYAGHDL